MTGVLAARARGLSTHLLDDGQLDGVARAGDRPALIAALTRAGFAPLALAGGDPIAVERAIRDRDRDERALLERWADDPRTLALLTADDDRRTLRAAARGAVAGAPGPARIAAAMPTPTLPEPALAALAAATTPAELADVVERCGHPAAATLAPLLRATPVDLLAIELALGRWFAERAAGQTDHALAVHAGQLVDVINAGGALMVAARGRELDPAAHFLPGGVRIDAAGFAAVATAPLTAAPARLAAFFVGTPLAGALAPAAVVHPEAIERAALAWHLATQAALRRTEPLGLAPLVWLLLRRRLESGRLRRAAWRLAMTGRGS